MFYLFATLHICEEWHTQDERSLTLASPGPNKQNAKNSTKSSVQIKLRKSRSFVVFELQTLKCVFTLNKSGLFSCPAIPSYCHSAAHFVCLPGALPYFDVQCLIRLLPNREKGWYLFSTMTVCTKLENAVFLHFEAHFFSLKINRVYVLICILEYIV